MDIGHPRLVAHVVHRVRAGLPADRPRWLDRSDPRFVDDSQTHEAGPGSLRPANAEVCQQRDTLGNIEADRDPGQHASFPFGKTPALESSILLR
jgi:hypothetical protein